MADTTPKAGQGVDAAGNWNVSGVYRIRCSPTGKVYVGSSLTLGKRLNGHRRKLVTGKHANAHLQAAWNKYGPDAFVFEVIETVDAEYLLDVEQRHIDLHDASNRQRGFNIRLRAESNVGFTMSPQSRALIAAAQVGRIITAETRAKIGAKHKGKTISPEARAKMAAAKIGGRASAETRAKMSASVRARGPEWNAKLSAAKVGNKNSLGRIQPPEVRAKIAAASKAMWAARRVADG